MSNQMHFQVTCRGKTYRLWVPKNSVTWGWIASKVLHLHNLSETKPITTLTIHSLLACRKFVLVPMNLDDIVTEKHAMSYYNQLLLLTEGNLKLLMNATNYNVVNEVLSYGSLYTLIQLMKVCKHLNVLLKSDLVWCNVIFNWGIWCGQGKDGSEDDEWNHYRKEAGLPLMNCYRIRWLSKNSSRLKLFYGSLNPILTPVVPKNESLNGIKKVIIIMGSNGNNITKRIMKQLHYLIPESATIFHHSSKCKPLLKSGILLDVSPSPVNSRSRNIYPDPGTRVESDHSYVFNFQRIGDQRLTFLQVDYYDDSYRIGAMEEFFGFCWSKTVANVFVIRISENKDIRSAYQLLKGFYNISLASMNLNEARKSLVVLVFVAIDLNSNNTFTNSDLHSHDHTIKNIVDTTVKAINDIMFKIVMERKHFLYDLVWYVQPVAYNNSEYDLTKGVYAGINWIVRTISSQC